MSCRIETLGNLMPHPKDLSWRVESVRLTLFLADLSPETGARWWEELAGAPPEESTAKRATGEIIDHGPFESARLWLNRNPLAKRIDWVLYSAQPPSDGYPGLSPAGEWLGKFDELMTRWLASSPTDALRIGYGATFVAPVADNAEGYAVLREALPMIAFDDDWSDFSFNVNKRQPLAALAGTPLAETKVNCLSKWNSMQMGFLQVPPTVTAPITFHAARIELDLNTDLENATPVNSENIATIMLGLGQLAARYTKEGFVS
jgi:hypothetical protein